ncbi:MAG TPA: SRPBCC domain-containing protein [Ktedonobacterales bacterium]|nr:SRPBCC domain-containing protein [Ktedonobacterales bacterium]
MRVEGTYTFPGAIERVFAALTNPDALARAIPGCERFIQFGPANADEETTYETRLRLGQRRLPYTVTLRMKAARRPAYVTLEIRGYGPSGPIAGTGSLDLVEQDSHTVVAYRFTVNGAELPEVGDTPSQSASFIARATCAHLADEIYAEAEDEQTTWLPSANGVSAGEFVTPRGRIVTRVRGLTARGDAHSLQPLAWTERALWMGAGLAMGLSAIALTAGVVRRMGSRASDAS